MYDLYLKRPCTLVLLKEILWIDKGSSRNIFTLKKIFWILLFFPWLLYIYMKDQSAQTTARNLSIAYGLWLPFLINRVLNLAKLRSVIYNQSVYSSCFTLWELINTAQIKRRSWRTRVLKLPLELWALHIACGYPLIYIYIYCVFWETSVLRSFFLNIFAM